MPSTPFTVLIKLTFVPVEGKKKKNRERRKEKKKEEKVREREKKALGVQ